MLTNISGLLRASIKPYIMRERPNYSSDFFIVEFPKSGITWFSQLIANSFLFHLNSDFKATYGSIDSFIPDLSINKKTTATRFGTYGPSFYKSHSLFDKSFINTIYLARHPCNVLPSYYNYVNQSRKKVDSIELFCRDDKYGVAAWKRHCDSWISHGKNSHNRHVYVLLYEDLLNNTCSEVKRLCDTFGWDISDAAIQSATKFCSREGMLYQEQLLCSKDPNHTHGFVKKETRQQDDIDIDLRNFITKSCSGQLDRLGYSNPAAKQYDN